MQANELTLLDTDGNSPQLHTNIPRTVQHFREKRYSKLELECTFKISTRFFHHLACDRNYALALYHQLDWFCLFNGGQLQIRNWIYWIFQRAACYDPLTLSWES